MPCAGVLLPSCEKHGAGETRLPRTAHVKSAVKAGGIDILRIVIDGQRAPRRAQEHAPAQLLRQNSFDAGNETSETMIRRPCRPIVALLAPSAEAVGPQARPRLVETIAGGDDCLSEPERRRQFTPLTGRRHPSGQ